MKSMIKKYTNKDLNIAYNDGVTEGINKTIIRLEAKIQEWESIHKSRNINDVESKVMLTKFKSFKGDLERLKAKLGEKEQ